MKDEFVAFLILGLLGFLIGGAVGHFFFAAFFPACLVGLAIAWGIPFCAHALD